MILFFRTTRYKLVEPFRFQNLKKSGSILGFSKCMHLHFLPMHASTQWQARASPSLLDLGLNLQITFAEKSSIILSRGVWD